MKAEALAGRDSGGFTLTITVAVTGTLADTMQVAQNLSHGFEVRDANGNRSELIGVKVVPTIDKQARTIAAWEARDEYNRRMEAASR